MAMTSIALTDEQLARLLRHAETSGRSLDEVVREAVDTYLSHLPETAAQRDAEPASGSADAPWQPPVIRIGADGAQVPIPPAMLADEVAELLAQPSSRARGDYLRSWLEKRVARVIHEPPPGPPDLEWQARFDAVTERIRQAGPIDLTPEEIEREITLARQEARRAMSDQ